MKDLKVQKAPNPNGFHFNAHEFQCLAYSMQRNTVRQHEFATFLRLLSSRFAPGSNGRQILRSASRTARCKEAKLRQLLLNLGRATRNRRQRTLGFILWSKLTKSAPIPLVILLLTLFTAKPVRGRLLDAFYPWKSAQHVTGWTHSLPRRSEAEAGSTAHTRRRAWHYLT
jgi:hypothetical protein